MATLTDAGALKALIDRGESKHKDCLELLPALSAPLVTTWPCVTEAMHLLYYAGGWHYQQALWRLIGTRALLLHSASAEEVGRMQQLMDKYWDVPMDLADASLVAAAETRQLQRIFTLDSDFRVYRIHNKQPFEAVP